MNKHSILVLLLAGTLSSQAQNVKEWLALPPIPVEKPALSNMKNVNERIFTDAMLGDFSGLNVQNLTPDNGKYEGKLKWDIARMEQDTVVTTTSGEALTLNYYATYISNPEWMSGQLTLRIFGNAEIYVDGVKKATANGANCSVRTVPIEWLPGKHLIVVKSLTKGGKVVYAHFEADKEFANEPVVFSVSPKRGKAILDVLNGQRISRLDVSPSGQYVLLGRTNIVNGKSTVNTYIYRIADKEIMYTFHGNSANNLQWIPGRDALSYMQNEGGSMSLYEYDLETRKQKCLLSEDKAIRNYIWSPDCSYLIYTVHESFADPKWELRKLAGVQDRQDYFRNRSYLCKYDFATGLYSRLTWGNLSTSLMDISRDGKKLLFSTSRPVYNEFPFNKQNVYLMDMATQQVDTLWKDRIWSVSCSFSPDGKQLLVQGGPSSFGKLGENITKGQIVNQYDTQLFIYDLASGDVQAITRNFNPSVEEAVWHKNGSIIAKVNDADFVRLYRYDGKEFVRIECPGDMVKQTSLAENSEFMMYTASTTNHPDRAYTLNLNDNQFAMWDNPCHKQYENIEFGEMKDWDYQYKKGTLIDGRYYLPADFDPNKKYPLIVYYYGGTTPVSRSFGGRWPFN